MSSGIDHVSEDTPIATTALVQDVSYKRKEPDEVDEKKTRSSLSINSQNGRLVDPAVNGETNVLAAKEEEEIEKEKAKRTILWRKIRPLTLSGLSLLILGWWISATVLPGTRNRWYVPLAGRYAGVPLSKPIIITCRIVQTVFAWFFILCVSVFVMSLPAQAFNQDPQHHCISVHPQFGGHKAC
jgi:hypothetical protein